MPELPSLTSSSEYPYFRLRNESLYFRLFARNSCGIGIFRHRDTDITGILSLCPLRLRGELKSDFHVSLRDILRFGTTPVRKYCLPQRRLLRFWRVEGLRWTGSKEVTISNTILKRPRYSPAGYVVHPIGSKRTYPHVRCTCRINAAAEARSK